MTNLDISDEELSKQLFRDPNSVDLSVRRVTFEYPPDCDPRWTNPIEFSWASNSLSLLMPHVEPFFEQVTKDSLDSLSDDLNKIAKEYITQEATHHGQHAKFNKILTKRYTKLTFVEKQMAWVFKKLSNRSRDTKVGFTAAFESIAYTIARWAEKHRHSLFRNSDPIITTLFMWHLAEEVEHKTVAYDIQKELEISLWAKFKGMTLANFVLIYFTIVSTLFMAIKDRQWFNPLSWLRLTKYIFSFIFDLLPATFFHTFFNQDPRKLSDPLFYDIWLQEYDFENRTMPLYSSQT